MTGVAGIDGRVARGGALLLARQLLGVALAFAGMLALARLLGPAASGLYFAAFGVVFFAQNLGRLGLDTYLVRAPGRLDPAMADQVFLLLCALGCATGAALVAASRPVALALAMPDLAPVLAALAASIPLTHLGRVPLARLERDLAYGRIGLAELAGQAAFFVVAIPAARAGWGAFAPVAGWWAQQALLLLLFAHLSRYRPAFRWRPALAREALAYGSVASGAVLVQSLRPLMIPILVGGTQGAAAVGVVSLAVRLLENLAVARTAISRIAVPLLARLSGDPSRLLPAFRLGMELQTLAVAVPVTVFSLVASAAIPFLFGPAWDEAARIVTLLSPPAILAGVFGLHLPLLMTLRRPHAVVLSQAAATALAWTAGAFLVPRLGAVGFAWAEIAAAAAWLVPALLVRRAFGPVRAELALVWAGAASLAALAPLAGGWALLALPALALHRPTRQRLATLLALARARRLLPP